MRDRERIIALSTPYSYLSDHNAASSSSPARAYQYHSETVLFSSAHGGRCLTVNAYDLLLSSHSELVPYIKTGRAFFQKGANVPDPKSGRSFTGFVVVGANTRDEVKRIAERVRAMWVMDVE